MAKINFGKLSENAPIFLRRLIDPRAIFSALPRKAPGLDYLRGPQHQILAEWHRRRDTRDLVIKMNPGGGKTLVGLLIAHSWLNEGTKPVAYLVPDYYLAQQVRAEAQHLGIEVTDDPRSPAFSSGRTVLVTVFAKLFNGQSIFGVAGSAGRSPAVELGAVLIDDAHACLAEASDIPLKRWTPSALRNEIFIKTTGKPGTFSAADVWCYRGQSLYLIALKHEQKQS